MEFAYVKVPSSGRDQLCYLPVKYIKNFHPQSADDFRANVIYKVKVKPGEDYPHDGLIGALAGKVSLLLLAVRGAK